MSVFMQASPYNGQAIRMLDEGILVYELVFRVSIPFADRWMGIVQVLVEFDKRRAIFKIKTERPYIVVLVRHTCIRCLQYFESKKHPGALLVAESFEIIGIVAVVEEFCLAFHALS